jgi:NAD dependent epimerase/dehydratase family enzyme
MSELFIFNQKVSCNKLMSDGYKFQYSDFKKALSDLIK